MSSKFRGIFDQAKGRAPVTADAPAVSPPPVATAPRADALPPSPAPPEGTAPRGPGRPRGKRSDPAFDQVTAYIPHELYRRVRLALLEDDRGQEFSELVGELLSEWLDGRRSD